MISLALNIAAFVFLLVVGFFVIGILGSLFSSDSSDSITPSNNKPTASMVKNPLPEDFNEADFEIAISKYKTHMNSIESSPEEVQSVALGFDNSFRFRHRLFQFLLFLYDTFWNQGYVKDVKFWWPKYLPPLHNIKVERNSGSEVSILLKMNDILINYHQIERGESYNADNENEVTISYKKKDVYKAGFYARGPYYFNKQKIVPEKVNLYLFKPSEWLLTLHTFLCKYELEYLQILQLKLAAEKKQETDRQKSNFQP